MPALRNRLSSPSQGCPPAKLSSVTKGEQKETTSPSTGSWPFSYLKEQQSYQFERYKAALFKTELDFFPETGIEDLQEQRYIFLGQVGKMFKMASHFSLQLMLVKMFQKYDLADKLAVLLVRSLLAAQASTEHQRSIFLDCQIGCPFPLVKRQMLGLNLSITQDVQNCASGQVNLLWDRHGIAILYFESMEIRQWYFAQTYLPQVMSDLALINQRVVAEKAGSTPAGHDKESKPRQLRLRLVTREKPFVSILTKGVKSRLEQQARSSSSSSLWPRARASSLFSHKVLTSGFKSSGAIKY